jgi:hypothetical protein
VNGKYRRMYAAQNEGRDPPLLHHVWCERCHAATARFENPDAAIAAWDAGTVTRSESAIAELPDPRACPWSVERNCHPCFCGRSSHPEAHEPAGRLRGLSPEAAVAHYGAVDK